jgi:hypothetical protein
MTDKSSKIRPYVSLYGLLSVTLFNALLYLNISISFFYDSYDKKKEVKSIFENNIEGPGIREFICHLSFSYKNRISPKKPRQAVHRPVPPQGPWRTCAP